MRYRQNSGISTLLSYFGLSLASVFALLFLSGLFSAGVHAQILAEADQEESQGGFRSLHDVDGETAAILERSLSLNLQQVSFKEALKTVAQEGGLGLFYNSDLIPAEKTVTLQMEDGLVREALQKLLASTDLEAIVSANQELILVERTTVNNSLRGIEERVLPATIQHEIHGRVTDAETGDPLPGVNVIVQGTNVGASTDAEGWYELTAPSGEEVLAFSFVGYLQQEVPVNQREEINVEMEPDVAGLEELVVVGYGEVERRDLTGSVASVNAEDINTFPSNNVMESMQGQVSGAEIIQSSGAPGPSVSVRIRGLNSIQGSNEPLYVVDGIPRGCKIKCVSGHSRET